MAIDRDSSVSLPTPPPPRPAARQAGIEAALRKFDGVEEARERPRRPGWATSHQRQLGALATAALIAVVSIPAALIALRDHPQSLPPPTPAPNAVQPAPPEASCTGSGCGAQDISSSSTGQAPPDETIVAKAPAAPGRSSVSSLVPLEGRNEVALPKAEQKAANETPAVPVAAAPPPPPPPSPPPAPAASEQYAGQASTQDMVVTGSRIRSPSLSSESDPRAAKSTAGAASPLSVIDPFGDFLSRLQADLKENNRRAVIGNVGFPLKVRESGHTRVYHSAEAVQQDFDRIFTAQVKVAILTQRAGRLTSRDAGRLMGNGKIWFGRTCPNKACSPAGPVRIREVNP